MGLHRGLVRGYDPTTGKATVEVVGSHPFYVEVPAGTHLSDLHLTAGKRCAVLFFDDCVPSDGLVLSAYDATAAILSSDRLKLTRYEAGNTDTVTTTSTTPVDVPDMTITLTLTRASLGLLLATAQCANQTSGASVSLLFADANNNPIGRAVAFRQNTADYGDIRTLHALWVVGPGPATAKLRWYVGSGTGRMASRTLTALVFSQ